MAIKLSPYHEIFYNEWKLDPTSPKYNIVFDQTISNNLNISQLKSALHRFISDYLLLNSHILETDNEYYWISNNDIKSLEQFNCYSTHAIYDYVSKPFDLESGPLYRFAIFNQTDGNYRFIIVLHHLIMDGISVDIFISTLSNYYNSSTCTQSLTHNQQIEDIRLTTELFDNQIILHENESQTLWNKILADIEVPDLRFLKPSHNIDNSTQFNKINEISFSFSEEQTLELKKAIRKYTITPYIYSRCIFAILLRRYTNQSNFGISYPIAIPGGVDFICGVKINTNIIPFTFNDITSISDLFSESKQFTKSLKTTDFNYGYYPINKIIAAGINKDLLQVCFAQTNLKDTKFNFADAETLTINREFNIDFESGLLFEQEIKGKIINFRVRYNKLETDECILNNFIKHYNKLFFDILHDLKQGIIDKPVSEYNILDTEDYRQIVYDWNKTEKPYPHNKTIHQLFEEQVERTPDNIAVIYEDIKLTYNELNLKANQLANYLKAIFNYKPSADDLIAICLPRSEYIIIAILGILKCGAAYIPIDLNTPIERIKYILSSSKTKILISYEKLIKQILGESYISTKYQFNSSIGCCILNIDNLEFVKKIFSFSVINVTSTASSNNLAYVVYTSGTTGNPKGVMVEHKSVLNYVSYLINTCKIDSTTIGSQCISFSFDPLVAEVYPIILTGAKLYIIPDEARLDISKINDFFLQHKITYAVLPTPLAQLFFNLKNNSLKTLIVGGDKLKTYAKQGYMVINAYGPTEATVQSNIFIVDRLYDNIPIGKPIHNVTNYVLDEYLQPLPIGAIGELFIGGAGIARGYLDNPELNAEKFIPNPFNNKQFKQNFKNNIIYRTGDLVRYLPDSNLEYFSRNDTQIKIRGYRIELSEIEALLCKYSGITQSIVLYSNIKDQSNLDFYKSNSINNDKPAISYEHQYNDTSSINNLLEQDDINTRELGMLPIQKWFFAQNYANINHWNQSFLIKTPKLNKDILIKSIIYLIECHDNFWLKYECTDANHSSYKQYYLEEFINSNNYERHYQRSQILELDITTLPHKEGTPKFKNNLYKILTNWQNNFDIKTGHLYSIGYIYGYKDGSARVFFALHHLIIDVISWHIILYDLHRIYNELCVSNNIVCNHMEPLNKLTNKLSNNYEEWAKVINFYAASNQNEKFFWLNMLAGYEKFENQLIKLLITNSNTKNNKISLNLSPNDTDKLINQGKLIFDANINQILLAVIALSIKKLLGSCPKINTVYFTLEGHGRENISSQIDISQTLGWFTTMFPIKLNLTNDNWLEIIKEVKQCLSSIPNNGIGYGALLDYKDTLPRLSFNYLGQINNKKSHNDWHITTEPCGKNIDNKNKPCNLIDIVGWISESQLTITFEGQIAQNKLNQLIKIFKSNLNNLIDLIKNDKKYYLSSNHEKNYSKIHNGIDYSSIMPNSNLLIKASDVEESTSINANFTKQLVAYYVSEVQIDVIVLRTYLAQYLPEYALPQLSVQLDKIPMTINGKIDIKALPLPENPDNHEYLVPHNEKLRLICDSFAKVLGIKKFGLHEDFFKCGGDSILVITLVMDLQKYFRIKVKDIYNYRTPYNLEHNLLPSNTTVKDKLLQIIYEQDHPQLLKKFNQKIIDDNINTYMNSIKGLVPDLSKKRINNILLTGVTGYLGCNLLEELITYTNYNIYILVRSESKLAALARVNKKYQLYFSKLLKNNIINSRVFILCGDLEKYSFGLSESIYAELTNRIDSVIHCAALVKQFGDENIFYKSNVLGTINLLEFTKLTKLKDFHYISTISILNHNNQLSEQWGENYTEDHLPDNLQPFSNNIYLQTKLEAERQIIKYRDYGVNSSIYRVGTLAFILKNLSVQENVAGTMFNYWLKYLLESKCILLESKINLSPVDLTANAIVKLFDKNCTNNSIYHLFNPYLFDLSKYMQCENAESVKILSVVNFIKYILDELENSTNTDTIIRFLLSQGWLDVEGMSQFAQKIYLQDKTQHILKCLNFEWTTITHDQFRIFIKKIL